ncbi:uncharacterized protein TNCV_3065481 [Trichonephila clavipes]|uniref:Uncharacterized protein n=1 Tax=Trichonephila clavipes TaxID=2585209 RepID=A0A8X6RNY6_TRICX|nr:uncharacterized protein TNCV_3065481 [Trichonephila clavipes]
MYISQSSVHFLKTRKSPFCESYFKTASTAFTHALLLAKLLPRNAFLTRGNIHKSHGVRSGLHGRGGKSSTLLCCETSSTQRALPWCNRKPFRSNGRFLFRAIPLFAGHS